MPSTDDAARRLAADEHRAALRVTADGGGGARADGSLAAEGRTAREDLCAAAVVKHEQFTGHWWPAVQTLAANAFAKCDG